ncbi:efflux RND transporter periplasmic adaptor subunit [Pseudomonas protegens]|uniref:efflux RND transporter periplasmic adaptor subunit n=1 Tax=Pseudomonas protegens TaxID=380021 RepID=UPI0027438024|nr:efflux RND transporter periplasmic adaptor subunit [Pseudomonas protegens]MDP9525305.1 efflux RND transporter periplasmic adaptor subunit [Pseudomonas protegens]
MDDFRFTGKQALTLFAGTLLAACGQVEPGPQATLAPQVTVARAIEQSVGDWDELSGRLEAPQTVEIRPRVSGHVDRVALRDGALVKAGDLLFQIDPRPFEAQVRALEAQLQQARAVQSRSLSEARRGERLRASSAISAELAEARSSAAEEARANAVSIQAQLDAARLNLSFTRVTAPISGRVSRAQVSAGNLVRSGDTLLTTLVSTRELYAYFDMDERLYLKYMQLARQEGRDARGRSPVYLGLSNEVGTPHLGHLDFLDNQVDPRTGTLRGRAVIENSQGVFTPGLYVRLKLLGSARYPAVLIKDEAVGTDLNSKFVMVVDDQDQTRYRAIELGPKLEGLRVVRNGLEQGERVVINGLQRVRPGMRVTPDVQDMASVETLAGLTRLNDVVEPAAPQAMAEVVSHGFGPRS